MEDDPFTDFDEAGLYWFLGLEQGEYEVREVLSRRFVQTFPLSGSHLVVLGHGQSIDGLDFGNRRKGRRRGQR
jgi:hypothetical protein